MSFKTAMVLGVTALMIAPALIAGTIYTDSVQRRAESVNISRLTTIGQMASNLLGHRSISCGATWNPCPGR
ncbi:hypothetical protein [Microvirga massiliensis]|uniref:hypothetical protein n=1 Tax=Microvirga massiliensis TaxID=1033741 RepID=UPI0011CA2683|nr:hypothetical protein [Microvirga massiliensis]